jgi:hypothetical protein
MFHSFAELNKLPKEMQQVKSYEDLKRVFQFGKIEYNFTCVPVSLAKDTSISCGAKIFWAIIHQLCGLGCTNYIQTDLAKIFSVGARMIQIYTNELRDSGWLKTRQCAKDNRKIEYVTKSSKFFVAILNKYLFDFTITTKAKVLWMILQEIGDANGRSFYSLPKIGIRYGRKDNETLKKFLTELKKAGWIKIEKGKGHRSKDIYTKWPDDRPNPKQISAMRKSKTDEKRKR